MGKTSIDMEAAIALRDEWLGLMAFSAIVNLALEGTEPTGEEWAAIEREEKIGLYEGSTQDDARKWLNGVIGLRERAMDS